MIFINRDPIIGQVNLDSHRAWIRELIKVKDLYRRLEELDPSNPLLEHMTFNDVTVSNKKGLDTNFKFKYNPSIKQLKYGDFLFDGLNHPAIRVTLEYSELLEHRIKEF